jgi:hypothetical protein
MAALAWRGLCVGINNLEALRLSGTAADDAFAAAAFSSCPVFTSVVPPCVPLCPLWVRVRRA